MRNLFVLGILSCCALLAAIGCGTEDGRAKVFPVQGQVLVKGQPAEGASVVFYPTTTRLQGPKMPVPSATTDGSGGFRLRSYEPDDGAPAGEFKVTVVWPESPPPNASGVFEVRDRLRGRYANPKTTELTATVEEGGGALPPFELQ